MSAIIASHQFPRREPFHCRRPRRFTVASQCHREKGRHYFVEPYIANQFLASHPGSIKNVTADDPVRVFPNTMMLKKAMCA